MWLAIQTRPDNLNAERVVASYSHAPMIVHWKAALHVLVFVRFPSTYDITFQRGAECGVHLEDRFGLR